MIYSVWNQGAGDFEYYETSAEQPSLNVEKPDHLVSRTLGSTIDQAAWPLPPGAALVGRGSAPVGRIASRGGGASLGDDEGDVTMVKVGLLVFAAFLLWKHMAPAGRRRRA